MLRTLPLAGQPRVVALFVLVVLAAVALAVLEQLLSRRKSRGGTIRLDECLLGSTAAVRQKFFLFIGGVPIHACKFTKRCSPGSSKCSRAQIAAYGPDSMMHRGNDCPGRLKVSGR